MKLYAFPAFFIFLKPFPVFLLYAITYQINRPKLIIHNSSVSYFVLSNSTVMSMAGALLRLMRMESDPMGSGVTAVMSVRPRRRPWKKWSHSYKIAGGKMRL